MEDWVHRALARWPNVPALYGWLRLDRRGRWLIRGEVINRPQIIDTINRNYAADERGCWYFQNGPQRGYVALDYAPLILQAQDDGALGTHTGEAVTRIDSAWLDEEGALLLVTEHGPGLLRDTDLSWVLGRLSANGEPIDDSQLLAALALPSGAQTELQLALGGQRLQLTRLDAGSMPRHFGFVRDPQPEDQQEPPTPSA